MLKDTKLKAKGNKKNNYVPKTAGQALQRSRKKNKTIPRNDHRNRNENRQTELRYIDSMSNNSGMYNTTLRKYGRHGFDSSDLPGDFASAERSMNIARLHPGYPSEFADHSSGLSWPSTVVSGAGSLDATYVTGTKYVVGFFCLARFWNGFSTGGMIGASNSTGVSSTIDTGSWGTTGSASNIMWKAFGSDDIYGGSFSELSQSPSGSGFWAMKYKFTFDCPDANKGSPVYVGSIPYGAGVTIHQLISAAEYETTTSNDWVLKDFIGTTERAQSGSDKTAVMHALARERIVYFVIASPQQNIGAVTQEPSISYSWIGNATWMPDYTNTVTQGISAKATSETSNAKADSSWITDIIDEAGNVWGAGSKIVSSIMSSPITGFIKSLPLWSTKDSSIVARNHVLGRKNSGFTSSFQSSGQFHLSDDLIDSYVSKDEMIRFLTKFLVYAGSLPGYNIDDYISQTKQILNRLNAYDNVLSVSKYKYPNDIDYIYDWIRSNDIEIPMTPGDEDMVIEKFAERLNLMVVSDTTRSYMLSDVKLKSYDVSWEDVNNITEGFVIQ
jgi:hypothetical protein